MNKLSIEEKVEDILKTFPMSRNNDKLLMWEVWKKYYGVSLWIEEGKFKEEDLPVCEIIRLRAKIQNDKKQYIPTSWIVAKQRQWKQEEWRKYLGYNIVDPNQKQLF